MQKAICIDIDAMINASWSSAVSTVSRAIKKHIKHMRIYEFSTGHGASGLVIRVFIRAAWQQSNIYDRHLTEIYDLYTRQGYIDMHAKRFAAGFKILS